MPWRVLNSCAARPLACLNCCKLKVTRIYGFDLILGRNSLTQVPDKQERAALLADWLALGGQVSLAEALPSQSQRLYELADLASLGGASGCGAARGRRIHLR